MSIEETLEQEARRSGKDVRTYASDLVLNRVEFGFKPIASVQDGVEFYRLHSDEIRALAEPLKPEWFHHPSPDTQVLLAWLAIDEVAARIATKRI